MRAAWKKEFTANAQYTLARDDGPLGEKFDTRPGGVGAAVERDPVNRRLVLRRIEDVFTCARQSERT